MRLGLALACALALAPQAAADPLTALTDRSDILGWEAVGRLNLDGRAHCSASLVGTRYVMTAAHCLLKNGAQRDLQKFTFQAGLRDGEAIATRAVSRAVVLTDYTSARRGSLERVRYDVGLLELAEPIPSSEADPFPLGRGVGEGRRVTVLSYGRGRMNAMSREIGCTVLAAQRGVVAFDCQASPGSSGAPIFDMSGRSPRIVALVSGGGVFDGKRAVYGMEIRTVVNDLRRAFQTGEGVWPENALTSRRAIGAADRSSGSARFVRP